MSSSLQRAAGADLGGLLAEQRGPDAELALALQRGRLDVPAADQREVAVEAAELVVGDVEGVVGVLDPLALGREQLDQVRLLRKVRGAGPGYGVDHLGGLVADAVTELSSPSPAAAGVAGGPAVVDVSAPGCGAAHTS